MNSEPDLAARCANEAELVIDRTIALSRIPAPPLKEAERAATVRGWWTDDGVAEVSIDVTGNVWGRVRAGTDPSLGAILVAAHLDTVFAETVAHGLLMGGDGILVGPGCGDDTVAVASLSSLRRLLPPTLARSVWVVATVGEEGLGNLRGVRAALDEPPVPLAAMIALEGNYLGRVNTVGVGSERRRVTVTTGGGHAWEHADAPSAVHIATDLVHAIQRVRPEGPARTSLNVGLIRGGESINARAMHCSFELDLRSVDAGVLADMVEAAEFLLTSDLPGVSIEVESVGSRPAGEVRGDHRLVAAAVAALDDVNVDARLTAASTDANAAYAIGLPAITLGITYGDGTHTEQEWIDTLAIPLGLQALATTICSVSDERTAHA